MVKTDDSFPVSIRNEAVFSGSELGEIWAMLL